ncbi:uncharacterized protein [Aristolochia californica]|uniref:uncharacterized protein n=1 Tax=Aristolochia californica TaxID=171875 RepID=UPI0035DEFE47
MRLSRIVRRKTEKRGEILSSRMTSRKAKNGRKPMKIQKPSRRIRKRGNGMKLKRNTKRKRYGTVEETEKKDSESRRTIVEEKRKTRDDSAEPMVFSAEAYDDESKLQRTVFMGNLPVKVKKMTLMKEYKCIGDIESVRIRSVPILDSKIPRKWAIFEGKINESIDRSFPMQCPCLHCFKGEKSAQAALSHNMAEVGRNHIRVDRAYPSRKKLKGESASLYDNKRTVFVGNLPFDVKDEELCVV